MKFLSNYGLAALIMLSMMYSCSSSKDKNADQPIQPNIILIMADDMGFSDIGCYGGEIQTPNLDALAQTGVRYTQFYNAARCCPTRASLMTGVYPHQAGMGWMTNADLGTHAYQGDLSKNAATIPEVLKPEGYVTYMSGKWHLSNSRKNKAMIEDNWPVQRGFDHFFGLVGGAGNYFKLPIFSGNKKYPSPDNFYLTDAISDSSVQFIDQHFSEQDNQPMFMYVAYTAPHWPLHALEEDIEKYAGVYDIGWDSIRELRLQKQYEIGLWNEKIDMAPRDEQVPAWETLDQERKKDFARRMEIYAAQIDAMDQGIGRIVNELKINDQLDNTIIFFLADNGGCAEYISSGKSKDLSGDLEDTWESYRIHWANASNTPFREYKHWIHEGGIRTPLIVHWPDGIKSSLKNSFIRDYRHLNDIMATCVDVSGARFPDSLNGNKIVPMQGMSLLPHFSGNEEFRGPVYWEHEGNIGMRDGEWKLVALTPENEDFDEDRLELYNISEDPTELNNLAEDDPQKLDEMFGKWKIWADSVNVYPLDTRRYGERSDAYKRKINGEFDHYYGDWDMENPEGIADFQIDKNEKLSGQNSAKISIQKNGQNPGDAALLWIFPPDTILKWEISFTAIANTEMNLRVGVEHRNDPGIEIANNSYTIGTEPAIFHFTTDKITQSGRYKLFFEVGNNSAGDALWLDAIELKPFN